MGFQCVEQKSNRQQVGAAARAETAHHEGSVHGSGLHAPVRLFDTAPSEKAGRCFLRVTQANGAAAVKQIGVFYRRQDCKEALYASRLGIIRSQPTTQS